ncbi:MAG: hypothetical protein MUC59_12395 [Saprospiraceae bacterium]|jgi:TfoX/Sxy family transcriptional regulator of competence genes|nr:hypothetical protein [Saprospiraceae bacterium]
MSKSIHVTSKNFKGLTKKEIDEQATDPDSELSQWSKKSAIKHAVKQERSVEKKPESSDADNFPVS